jgi:hypothetical protein
MNRQRRMLDFTLTLVLLIGIISCDIAMTNTSPVTFVVSDENGHVHNAKVTADGTTRVTDIYGEAMFDLPRGVRMNYTITHSEHETFRGSVTPMWISEQRLSVTLTDSETRCTPSDPGEPACGGTCEPCEDLRLCLEDADCASERCSNGMCRPQETVQDLSKTLVRINAYDESGTSISKGIITLADETKEIDPETKQAEFRVETGKHELQVMALGFVVEEGIIETKEATEQPSTELHMTLLSAQITGNNEVSSSTTVDCPLFVEEYARMFPGGPTPDHRLNCDRQSRTRVGDALRTQCQNTGNDRYSILESVTECDPDTWERPYQGTCTSYGTALCLKSDEQPTPEVTLRVNREGSGSITGGPIDCPDTCAALITYGDSVSLSAQPEDGYVFERWSGACEHADPECIVTMSGDTRVTAHFALDQECTPGETQRCGDRICIEEGGLDVVVHASRLCSADGTWERFCYFRGTYDNDKEPCAQDQMCYRSLDPAGGEQYDARCIAYQEHKVTITKEGLGSGDVSGEGTYEHGDYVTLRADPDPGSRFKEWSGVDCLYVAQTTAQCTVHVNEPIRATAHFEVEVLPEPVISTFTVTVQKSGEGSGTIQGPGLNCGPGCTSTTVQVEEGSEIDLTASAEPGSVFLRWGTGCAQVSDDGRTCSTGKVRADRRFTATFARDIQHTLTVRKQGPGGSISGGSSPTQIECGAACSSRTLTLQDGESVAFNANPTDWQRYRFVEWEDCDETSGLQGMACIIRGIDRTRTVTALFESIPNSCDEPYPSGTGVWTNVGSPTMPSQEWDFVDGTSPSGPCQFGCRTGYTLTEIEPSKWECVAKTSEPECTDNTECSHLTTSPKWGQCIYGGTAECGTVSGQQTGPYQKGVCNDGTCEAKWTSEIKSCSKTLSCPTGEQCTNSKCEPIPECTDNTECSHREVTGPWSSCSYTGSRVCGNVIGGKTRSTITASCVSGKCETTPNTDRRECTTSAGTCSSLQLCTGGQCVAKDECQLKGLSKCTCSTGQYMCVDSTTANECIKYKQKCDAPEPAPKPECTLPEHCAHLNEEASWSKCTYGGFDECGSLEGTQDQSYRKEGVCRNGRCEQVNRGSDVRTCTVTVTCPGSDVCKSGKCVAPQSACPPGTDECSCGGCGDQQECYDKCNADDGDDEGSYLCGYFYRQGRIPDSIYRGDIEFASSLRERTVRGYQWWARPLVEHFKENPGTRLEKLTGSIVEHWAQEMAYRAGYTDEGSLIGQSLLRYGVPLMEVVGAVHDSFDTTERSEETTQQS